MNSVEALDPREDIDNCRRQLDGGFRSLRFSRDLETEFQANHFEGHKSFMRAGQLLAAALYICFVLVMLATQDFSQFLLQTTLLRAGIIVTMLATAFFITTLPWTRYQPLVAANYVIFAAGLISIELTSDHFGVERHYEGIIFGIFHCALFGCLMFRYCLWTCVAVFAIYAGTGWMMGLPTKALAYETFFLILAIVMALASLYQVEWAERDGFLRRRIMGVLANFDELTGLASRAAFDGFLRQYLRQNKAGQLQALVLIDIDHFKQLNDSRGHDTGDKCLQLVANILRRRLAHAPQAVARWGGDELIAVLPVADEQELASRMEKIRQDVAQLAMTNPGSPHQYLSISIGALLITPEQRVGETVLFREADAALYEAKQTGRNRVVIHHAHPDESRPQGVASPQ